MLVIKLLFGLLVVAFSIPFIIFLALYVPTRDEIIQFFKNGIDILNGTDADKKIIAKAILFYFPLVLIIIVVSDKSVGLQPMFSFLLQFTAVTLGTVAATIAYRNYRRKSGDKLLCKYWSKSSEVTHILLHNEKDKLVSIFAIDVILPDKRRIRIASFNYKSPLTLSAFESKEIKLDTVHSYGVDDPRGFDFIILSEVCCITSNGEILTTLLNLEEMQDNFLKSKNILEAYRVLYIPNNYQDHKIGQKAMFWITIGIQPYRNGMQYSNYSYYYLTGYIKNKLFYLTDESLDHIQKNTILDNVLRKEIHGLEVSSADYERYGIAYSIYYPEKLTEKLAKEIKAVFSNKCFGEHLFICDSLEPIHFTNTLYLD